MLEISVLMASFPSRRIAELSHAYRTLGLGYAIALAEQTGLTTYDASYLWLARELRAELVTLDGQLFTAVKSLH